MKHLSYEECVRIEAFLSEGYSHRRIGEILWRSNGSISREIRIYSTDGAYIASLAYLKRNIKRQLCNSLLHCRIDKWSALAQYIVEKMQDYWSPEQIAWRWRRETWESISKDTIYRYIKIHHPKLVPQYFRRKWKKYRYNKTPCDYIYNRISIHQRPEVVQTKERIGDREGDTVIGKWRKWGFVTLNERRSGYLLAGVMKRKKAKEVTHVIASLLKTLSPSIKKTLTLDNGREFSEHYMLKPLCGLDTYFADPWSPWQRWANENTNGLLRQFYPKHMSLANIQQEQLAYYVSLLNNRPRKRLGYATPIEVLAEYDDCVDLN